jgi:hypothetical protein
MIDSVPFPKDITRTISKRMTSIADASKEVYIRQKWFPIAVRYPSDSKKWTSFQDAGKEVPIQWSY